MNLLRIFRRKPSPVMVLRSHNVCRSWSRHQGDEMSRSGSWHASRNRIRMLVFCLLLVSSSHISFSIQNQSRLPSDRYDAFQDVFLLTLDAASVSLCACKQRPGLDIPLQRQHLSRETSLVAYSRSPSGRYPVEYVFPISPSFTLDIH